MTSFCSSKKHEVDSQFNPILTFQREVKQGKIGKYSYTNNTRLNTFCFEQNLILNFM